MIGKAKCSWCGKKEDEVSRMMPGPVIFICSDCIHSMSGAIKSEDASMAEQAREEIDRAVQESFRAMVKQINLGPLQDKYQRLMRVGFKEELGSPTFVEVFQEFKKGVEAEVPSDDFQTRYDLAIAYNEMGLEDDSYREMIQALRGALRQGNHDRAGEIMGALIYMHQDSARVIKGIYKAIADSGIDLPDSDC